jgi:hypothetical protein
VAAGATVAGGGKTAGGTALDGCSVPVEIKASLTSKGSSDPATDASDPATDASDPATDASDPATDASDSATDASDSATDASLISDGAADGTDSSTETGGQTSDIPKSDSDPGRILPPAIASPTEKKIGPETSISGEPVAKEISFVPDPLKQQSPIVTATDKTLPAKQRRGLSPSESKIQRDAENPIQLNDQKHSPLCDRLLELPSNIQSSSETVTEYVTHVMIPL